MSEEDIGLFMEITAADRRTAIFCLQRNSRNLQQAISFFYDAGRVIVPADFMPDLGADPGPLRRPGANPFLSPPSPAPPPPPPPPPLPAAPSGHVVHAEPPGLSVAARRARNLEVYAREDPPLVVPYAAPSASKPKKRDCEEQGRNAPGVASAAVLFPDEEVERVECIVWQNGISLCGTFFQMADDRRCRKALKQIQANRMPSALADDLDGCQLDLVFRQDVCYGEPTDSGNHV
jgi:hypothetical protein